MNSGSLTINYGLAGLIEAGGVVVVLLIGLSVFVTATLMIKLWQFWRMRIGNTSPAQQALVLFRQGDCNDALLVAEQTVNPAAKAMVLALRGMQQGLPENKVYDEVLAYGSDVLAELRLWFRPLEVVAALAPLLGLFGTVLGMIEAFQQLENAGNQVNPALLSGGIWEALLTTAAGLSVAMPTVVVLNWLERKVDRLAQVMDSTVNRVFSVDLSDSCQQAKPQSVSNERDQPLSVV